MPDVREELGRLAGEAGEPGGLDDLAATRRRRERRRRTTSLIGGLGVLLLGVLVAIQLGGGSAAPVPGDTSPPAGGTPSAVATVWPENAVNGSLPSSVQAALDGGDEALRWRTDPKQVVERFGGAVLGRDMRIVDVEQLDDGVVVYAFPCQAGEKPVGDGCDVGEQIAFHVIQAATAGEGGIWSVASVNSMPLAVTVLGEPSSGDVREGDDVTFDVGALPPSTTAHLGIVVANGCNVVHAVDDQMAAGPARLAVPSVGVADPSCATPPGGFAFLYVTDDTTLPTTDPIDEPTAIEYPWLSIVPFSIMKESASFAPTPTPSASAAAPSASVPEVDCTSTDVTVVEQGIALSGCQDWAAGEPLRLTFRIEDPGVAEGLELFAADRCTDGTCSGQPVWRGEIDTGRAVVLYDVPPLQPGRYVLRDPVHPTAAMRIDVR